MLRDNTTALLPKLYIGIDVHKKVGHFIIRQICLMERR